MYGRVGREVDMKDSKDSEDGRVVSLQAFRQKKTKKLFADFDDMDLTWPHELQDVLDEWADDDEIPDVEVIRLLTILGCVDDSLQALYHSHAVITSDTLWSHAETIQKQIHAMIKWAEQQKGNT